MTNFVPLDIVNDKGERWQPKPVVKERRSSLAPQKYHRGWLVHGWSVAQLDELDSAREKLREAQRKNDKPMEPRFDRESHMRAHRGSKLTPKHLVTQDAAVQFANIASSSGFLGVTVFEDKKE